MSEKKLPPNIPRFEPEDPLEKSPKFEEWLKTYAPNAPETAKNIKARVFVHPEKFEKIFDNIVHKPPYPLKTSDEWKINVFIRKLGEYVKNNRAFRYYLEACVHCGYCMDKCHVWIATRDPNNTPVGRADLIRAIYKKYFTTSGKLFGNAVGAKELTKEYLDKIWTYFHHCTECRRCSIFCPMGIDTAEITRVVRQIFLEIGMVYDFVAATLDSVVRTGNNMYITPAAARDALNFIEDEMESELGFRIHIPLDKEKADVLLLPSSTDLFINLDTMKGYAKLLYTLGIDYTLDSSILEVGNFGLFTSEEHLRWLGQRAVHAALKRGVKLVLFGECGHGWRAFKNYTMPELFKRGIYAIHIIHLAYWALKTGRVKIKQKVPGRFTYHDPCNLARAGDLVEEPREIIKMCVEEFVEREHNRERTLCCGAGSGLLGEDVMPLRVWAGWPSVYSALKTGAKYMLHPCAIDKAQFPVVIQYHGVPLEAKGVMDVVGYAIDVPKEPPPKANIDEIIQELKKFYGVTKSLAEFK